MKNTLESKNHIKCFVHVRPVQVNSHFHTPVSSTHKSHAVFAPKMRQFHTKASVQHAFCPLRQRMLNEIAKSVISSIVGQHVGGPD